MTYMVSNKDCLKSKMFYYGPEVDSLSKRDNCKSSEVEFDNITQKNDVVFLCNELDMNKIIEMDQISDCYLGYVNEEKAGYPLLPFYVYYDKEVFEYVCEYTDISYLCKRYRIVLIVGEEKLEEFFSHLDVIFPNKIYAEENIKKKILYIFEDRIKLVETVSEKVSLYYEENRKQIRERIQRNQATIGILSYKDEPKKFQEFYRQIEKYYESIGCSVLIFEERESIFRTPESIILYNYCPDFVIQINKTKGGAHFQGNSVRLVEFQELIYVNWVQDIHPAVLNPSYAKQIKRNEYIFSLFDANVMKDYGFPEENVIYGGAMPADEKSFVWHSLTGAEKEKYECDVSFIGNIMSEKEVVDFIYFSLKNHLSDEAIVQVGDMITKMINDMYRKESGEYIANSDWMKFYLNELQEKIKFTDEVRGEVHRVLYVVRYNSLRKLIMEQLAREKKYRIRFYGSENIGIDGIEYGGFISEKKELSKALQSSRIVMQINPDATMNQRVVEGIFSHSIVLTYKMQDSFDMSAASRFLEEKEGIIYFGTKKEMLDKIDFYIAHEQEYQLVVENGYKRIKSELSIEGTYNRLLEGIKLKIQ